MKPLRLLLFLLACLCALSCTRSIEPEGDSTLPVATNGSVELFMYGRIESTHSCEPMVEAWALTNGHTLRVIFADTPSGIQRARDLKISRVPSIVVFDPADKERARIEGTAAIEEWVNQRM
jgi:hypothetical protein